MSVIKCKADFPVIYEDDYNKKEYLIQCLYVLSKMDSSEFDENVIRLYSIFDIEGNLYNDFISCKKDISSIEYHTTSKISNECRKKLKKPVTLNELINYILSKMIVISKIEMCNFNEYNNKIKCINRSYKNIDNKNSIDDITNTLLYAYYARMTLNTENSYIKKVFTKNRVLNDANRYFEELKENEKDLFLSLR